jgi:hypothetical protein
MDSERKENPGLLWPRLHLFRLCGGGSGWLELVDSKDRAWSPCFARYHDLSGHTRSFARRVDLRIGRRLPQAAEAA